MYWIINYLRLMQSILGYVETTSQSTQYTHVQKMLQVIVVDWCPTTINKQMNEYNIVSHHVLHCFLHQFKYEKWYK